MIDLKDFVQEHELNSEFEAILLEDVRLLMLCLQKTTVDDFYFETHQTSTIYESLSQLDNFRELYKIFRKFFQKLPNDFEEKEYEVNVEDAKTFCKEIKITLKHSSNGNTAKYESHSDDFSTIYISIKADNHKKNSYNTNLCGLVLHEILHAYEDKCRIDKNKPSIFDEFTNKYDAGFANINRQDFVIKNLAVLNYFLNDKEQRAYLSTIELDIMQVLDKIRPTFLDMKTDKVLKELKRTGVWKTYFEFGKFVAFIDKIDDRTLEKSYYFASKTSKEQHQDIRDDIERIKNKEKPVKKYFIKPAGDIRKECKRTWEKFQRKFNSVFVKVYGDIVTIK